MPLEKTLPAAVLEYLRAGQRGEIIDTPDPDDPVFSRVKNVIIGSNLIAAQAAVEAARQQGFSTSLLSTYIEGEAREVGRVLAGLAKGVVARVQDRKAVDLAHRAALGLHGAASLSGPGGRNNRHHSR